MTKGASKKSSVRCWSSYPSPTYPAFTLAETFPAKRRRGRPKKTALPLVSSVAAQHARDLSQISSVCSDDLQSVVRRTRKPVGAASLTILPTPQPGVEVQVPFVPPYVPANRPFRGAVHWQYDSHTAEQLKGSVISRFTKNDGLIGFTVRIGSDIADASDEVDVDLANVYDYVTPEELERFENLDWEKEIERDRNRPKVGRPRKTLLNGGESPTVLQNSTKRPLGRPRKHPIKAVGPVTKGQQRPAQDGDSAFLGVHIPSPAKNGQETANATSPLSSTSLSLIPHYIRRNESTALSVEATSTSAEGDTPMQIDQLTPSNAKRVIGVRIPDKSLLKHPPRASYPMVEAALGRSDSSDIEDKAVPDTEDEAVPDSESEDELALQPSAQLRRFANGTEIPNSRSGTEDHDRSLFVSTAGSPWDQSSQPDNRKASEIESDTHSVVFSDASVDSETPEDILEKSKASNARRIQAEPTESAPTARPRFNFIDQYFQPKHVASAPIPSLTPYQAPNPVSSRAESAPDSQTRSQKSTLASPHQKAAPPQAASSTQRRQQQPKIPRQPRTPGNVGTNIHSAVAGITTTNALSLLSPPPPNVKPGSHYAPWMRLTEYEMATLRKRMKKNAIWFLSETVIRRELADAGRGPDNYRRAKVSSEALGEPFLDVDSLANQPSGLRLKHGQISADSLVESSTSNRGMKLNEAKRVKREEMLKAEDVAREAAQMLENIASKAHEPISRLATTFSVRPGTYDRLPPAPSMLPPQHSVFSSSRPIPSPHKETPKQSLQLRKSMTPHFPPSQPRQQGAISPALRNGTNRQAAASNGSPVKPPRRVGTLPPTRGGSLMRNRAEIHSQISARGGASPAKYGEEIDLGSPITTSSSSSSSSSSSDLEIPTHRSQSFTTNSRPQFQQPKLNIILGSPETSSSSSEPRTQPKPTQPPGRASLPNGQHGRKRHRSSNGSSDDGERPWYQMVRR
ncbi:MAG: hypothetical protein Q9207_005249 [Kuettlingeria erythrocarpa]